MENINTLSPIVPNSHMRRIEKYDGQSIFINSEVVYTLGNYLGGGASGSVYQASSSNPKVGSPRDEKSDPPQSVAIKILHPLGFKLLSVAQLQK